MQAMTKDLALFPLNLVVFPTETLNLHIFEPRYKDLINDCLESGSTFAIPSYVLTKIEYGTEVSIKEVVKRYEDGRMDIRVKGLREIRVVNFYNPWRDYEYAGGTVEVITKDDEADETLRMRIVELCIELFEWLHIQEEINMHAGISIYEVIHKIGLKAEEEYLLLQMRSEQQRQHYIVDHLDKLIPALKRAEMAKERIRMNGHFQHLTPPKF